MNNVILVDCDGVLLDWLTKFEYWLKQHYDLELREGGHTKWNMEKRYNVSKDDGLRLIEIFNESAHMAYLAPYKDAIKYVKKLHEEHGYVFHVITSFTGDEQAHKLRTMNLERLFGKNVFERYVYLNLFSNKDHVLSEYEGTECYWIEDRYSNCVAGEKFGLRPLMMAMEHNKEYEKHVTRVENWKSVYNIITGNL